jgi:hypothetical protein
MSGISRAPCELRRHAAHGEVTPNLPKGEIMDDEILFIVLLLSAKRAFAYTLVSLLSTA